MGDVINHTSDRASEVFERVDRRFVHWLGHRGPMLLRVAIGVVFVWFGALKFFPALSPAEDLAGATIERLTLGIITSDVGMVLLATLEVAIGLGLMFWIWPRVTLAVVVFHLLGTMTPLVLFPDLTFTVFPIAPTLEGQYILKNFVLIAAGLTLGALVRGAHFPCPPGCELQARDEVDVPA